MLCLQIQWTYNVCGSILLANNGFPRSSLLLPPTCTQRVSNIDQSNSIVNIYIGLTMDLLYPRRFGSLSFLKI